MSCILFDNVTFHFIYTKKIHNYKDEFYFGWNYFGYVESTIAMTPALGNVIYKFHHTKKFFKRVPRTQILLRSTNALALDLYGYHYPPYKILEKWKGEVHLACQVF